MLKCWDNFGEGAQNIDFFPIVKVARHFRHDLIDGESVGIIFAHRREGDLARFLPYFLLLHHRVEVLQRFITIFDPGFLSLRRAISVAHCRWLDPASVFQAASLRGRLGRLLCDQTSPATVAAWEQDHRRAMP